MSGVNYTSGFAPIDVSGIRKQQMHDPMGHNSRFDKVLGQVGMGLSAMGPALDAGLRFGGFTKGAAITSAAVMGLGTAGGGGATIPMAGTMGAGGPTAKYLSGPPGPPPGYPGGTAGGIGAPPGFSGAGGLPGSTSMASQYDGHIDAMYNRQIELLTVQGKMQEVATSTQMMSNLMKSRTDTELNTIRNVRA